MRKVVVVYHSRFGHTQVLAEAVRRGAASVVGVETDLIPVAELPPPDERRAYSGKWSSLDDADAIIFGCPTYMGAVSAGLKEFMESSSALWVTQTWKNKIAAGFTNSGSQSGDKLNTLQDLVIFAAQHAMIWVGLDLLPGNNSSQGSVRDLNRLGSFLGAMAQSNTDQGPNLAPPESDQRTAERLGARVAEAVLRWNGESR